MRLADSTVVVAAEWTTGYSMAVWRCHGHVGKSVEACLRHSSDAVVTVTPLTRLAQEQEAEPTPEPPPGRRAVTAARPLTTAPSPGRRRLQDGDEPITCWRRPPRLVAARRSRNPP
jgi:hypothetical protein